MPATAGRVRMPANNRVHSSAALQTHGIWQSAIGYDPYAPNKEDKKDSSHKSSNAEPDAENAYASFQGLLALARITNSSSADVDRGACKKCGRVGHLKFQCKNNVKIKDDNEEKDLEAIQVAALVGLDKLKGNVGKADKKSKVESSEESEEEDDSDSSDSEVDSEIERILAERAGKKISGKRGSSRKKRDSDDDDLGTDSGKWKKRGRSKNKSGKRDRSDSDDSGHRRRKRRKEHGRKKDKSSDEDDGHRERQRKSRKEKKRQRSRHSYHDSETSDDSYRQHKRKGRRAASSSDTDSSSSDDSRMGSHMKRSEKGRRRHHEDDI